MQDHLSTEQISRYRERLLSAREILAVENHLTLCPECRDRAYNPQELQSAFHSLRGGLQAAPETAEHLSYEEKKAYITDQADPLEREVVESHVASCSQCATELKSLRQFAAMMEAHQASVAAPKLSWWEKFLAAVGLSVNQATVRWAGLAAAIVVIAGIVASVFLFPTSGTDNPLVGSGVGPPNSNMLPQPTQPPPTTNANSQQPVPPSVPAVATVTLLPSFARGGEGKRFTIGEATRQVRFEVVLEEQSYKSYRATLQNAAGKPVNLGTAKAGKANKVVFTLSSQAGLSSGEYLLMLSGVTDDGGLERVGNYAFQIVKR
jgi:anti-sigma factor RsiW